MTTFPLFYQIQMEKNGTWTLIELNDIYDIFTIDWYFALVELKFHMINLICFRFNIKCIDIFLISIDIWFWDRPFYQNQHSGI